jgi:NADPH:quinone reductase-like Zn-dependent oxidoreductase
VLIVGATPRRQSWSARSAPITSSTTRERISPTAAPRYDVILDIAGSRSLSDLRRALTRRGTLVIVGGEDAGNWLGMRRQLSAAALSPFVRQKLGFFISKERPRDLEELSTMLETGTIRPVVERTFMLEEVPEAIRYLREGHARGKVVITV